MKNKAHKKLEGYIAYNRCEYSPTRFFSGYHDTFKKGMPNNDKELCEEYIKENHPHSDIIAIKAIMYYEYPEDKTFCNKSPKCRENVCYCKDLCKKI